MQHIHTNRCTIRVQIEGKQEKEQKRNEKVPATMLITNNKNLNVHIIAIYVYIKEPDIMSN